MVGIEQFKAFPREFHKFKHLFLSFFLCIQNTVHVCFLVILILIQCIVFFLGFFSAYRLLSIKQNVERKATTKTFFLTRIFQSTLICVYRIMGSVCFSSRSLFLTVFFHPLIAFYDYIFVYENICLHNF